MDEGAKKEEVVQPFRRKQLGGSKESGEQLRQKGISTDR